MFGVLFGEDNENTALGVLLFQSENKALEAFTSLIEKTNVFNNQLFQSWNLKLCAVFNSVDIDDFPEVEVSQIEENTLTYIDFDGNLNRVHIINSSNIPCL